MPGGLHRHGRAGTCPADPGPQSRVAGKVRERGVRVCLDDFGSGPASLPALAEKLHELGYHQGMGFHHAVPQPATAIPLFLADASLLTQLA